LGADVILVLVVATALVFTFTNGFADAGHSVATSISTRAMSPRRAVTLAASLNFAGAFVSLEVAATVATALVEAGEVDETVVLAGLVGAIGWNLATWHLGLPSSSSHALIGGVAGAALVGAGPDAVLFGGLRDNVVVPALVAPVVAFAAAGIAILLAYRIVGRLRPGPVNRGFRVGQTVSGGLYALGHGANDAQKSMGVITLALIATGHVSAEGFEVPLWVVASSAAAIALGTWSGGWRTVRTAGARVIKMDSAQAFSAQSGGAAVVLVATHLGYPLSTTHVLSGSVMGAGAARRLSAVRWGVAGNILAAWAVTLPAAAAIGAAAFGVTRILGAGALGPILATLCLLTLVAVTLGRRRRRRAPAPGGGT
jgi:inorganic phosphate transporter, PiT family